MIFYLEQLSIRFANYFFVFYDACQLDSTNRPGTVYVLAIARTYVSPSDLYFVILY